VPYDWKRDLAPVSMAAVGYQVLLVDPKLPVKTLADFIALAKAKPGALNFASIGVGTAPHLAGLFEVLIVPVLDVRGDGQIETPSGAIRKKSWQAVSITVGLSTPMRLRQPSG
jgi:hypothetical protein